MRGRRSTSDGCDKNTSELVLGAKGSGLGGRKADEEKTTLSTLHDNPHSINPPSPTLCPCPSCSHRLCPAYLSFVLMRHVLRAFGAQSS